MRNKSFKCWNHLRAPPCGFETVPSGENSLTPIRGEAAWLGTVPDDEKPKVMKECHVLL